MGEKIKAGIGEWMDKLIKEHARELLIGLLNQYGITMILSQVISILRSTQDESLLALSKDLERALDNHESKNCKKQVGKQKIGFASKDADESAEGEKKTDEGFLWGLFSSKTETKE